MSLQKLKMIKDLTIKNHTPAEIIIDIAKELPNLEYLEISSVFALGVSWIIDVIIRYAKKLTKFYFNGKEIKINVNE